MHTGERKWAANHQSETEEEEGEKRGDFAREERMHMGRNTPRGHKLWASTGKVVVSCCGGDLDIQI